MAACARGPEARPKSGVHHSPAVHWADSATCHRSCLAEGEQKGSPPACQGRRRKPHSRVLAISTPTVTACTMIKSPKEIKEKYLQICQIYWILANLLGYQSKTKKMSHIVMCTEINRYILCKRAGRNPKCCGKHQFAKGFWRFGKQDLRNVKCWVLINDTAGSHHRRICLYCFSIQDYCLAYLPVSYKKAEITSALFTTESLPACPHRHSIHVYERKGCREGAGHREEGSSCSAVAHTMILLLSQMRPL